MRVLLLTHAVVPDRLGGLERYVRELGAALVRAGADVTIVAKRVDPATPPEEVAADGVRVVRHAAPAQRRRWYAAAIPFAPVPAVLRESRRGPDVVHGHYVLPMLGPLATGRRYVYTFHAPMWRELLSERSDRFKLAGVAQRPAQTTVRALEAATTMRAHRTVVLSQFMHDEVARLSARAAGKVVVIPGGVDTARFSPGRERPHGRHPVLFTARRLTPRTGVEELVDAMAQIATVRPDARLAIAGDGALRGLLEARIVALGLGASVTLLGRVSEDELVRRYRGADLVVMPTRELEGFGLTTAEAMACGTPVVGTPVGANPELLAGLGPEFVTRSADAPAIAEAVLELLAAPARLAAARAAARPLIAPAMGWDAVAARYLDLYEQMRDTP